MIQAMREKQNKNGFLVNKCKATKLDSKIGKLGFSLKDNNCSLHYNYN